jgi:hypothetical protein
MNKIDPTLIASDPESNKSASSINGDEPVLERTDPFDLESLRISPDYLKTGGAKKLLNHIPIRRPNKQDFIRVHPGPEYRFSPAALIVSDEEGETFLVTSQYFPQLEEAFQSLFTLYLTVNRQKVLTFWPIKLPGPDGRINTWHLTAHEVAQAAMKTWVRVTPNRSLRGYEAFEAETRLPEPEWPQLPLSELLEIAFKGRIIANEEHPVIKRLRGAI